MTNDTQIADEIIDSRIPQTLRDYVNDNNTEIKSEANKAWYILGFLWTILFIASKNLANIDSWITKRVLFLWFLTSIVLALIVIHRGRTLYHISTAQHITFDRAIALVELRELYHLTNTSLRRKITLNTINMILCMTIIATSLRFVFFSSSL